MEKPVDPRMAQRSFQRIPNVTVLLVSAVPYFHNMFSGGSCLNLRKIVCCPKRAHSRISHSLILRSEQSKPREIAAKKYEDHTMELGGPEFLPDQLYEASTELFTPLLLPDNDSLEFSEDENTPMNIMKHIGEGQKIHRKSYKGKPPPFIS